MQLLAGDIGGTHTRLICADGCGREKKIIAEKSYLSANYSSLQEVLDIFLAEHQIATPVAAACFAVAGPVEFGFAAVTNLPWRISEQALSDALHTSQVKLINDFVAVAHGIAELQASDMLTLQPGAVPAQSLARPEAVVVGAGTGFGASHLVWLNDHYRVYASEAGHTDFAPANARQTRLLAWLQTQHAHVSLERLLSGKGLVTIYQFLRDIEGLPESQRVNQAMQTTDPAQVITEQALLQADNLSQQTLEIFVDIYGAAAGNVALHHYPVAELYIAGGIAPKIRALMGPRFMQAFLNKGPMSANMQKITVKLITQERVGLYGALSQACAFSI